MAKVETVNYTNDAFKTYLLQLSTDLVWKNSTLAKQYEDNTDPYLVELYVTANRGVLNFDVIRAFPRSVLAMIGIPEIQIDECASDKNRIPMNLRSAAVQEYQEALCSINPSTGHHGYETPSGWVSVYEERNDYYRMLNGLPGINETHFIYNTDLRWPTDIPVHELSLVSRLEMEEAGVLDKLYAANPDAEYLKYCGSRMISVYKARVANRFEILLRNSIDSATLEEDFESVYTSCCNLVNSVFYSDAFKKTNILYENFLAMCILFMTLQTMQYHYLSVDVIRDFYDTESIKYVYDSYSVPFYNEIPLEYHRKIVKNINTLIGYKGSSQVFFDLFDIFNTNMSIYTYYLTKVHRFDENGNPEFVIKTDEDGNPIYDKYGNPVLESSNYDIAFARGEIYQDPALSVADSINKSEYDETIAGDPYWVDDAYVKNVIENSSFNFNETKYIGVQTTFDLLKIAYENAYIFKMIVDNKSITNNLILQWPDVGINPSYYQVFIYLAAIVCKYHGYEGLISDNLPYTAAVLGYDFKKSATIIQDTIDNNPYLRTNTELKNKIMGMKITNVNSVNTTFGNLQEIESMLISGYINATTKDEFNAYRDLYNTLMTSKIIDEVYTVDDGSVAESFNELLKAIAPDLYTRYITMTESELENELTVITDKLEESLINLKYSPHSLGVESSSLIENLFRILRFFKSAKAEIIGYNVIYTITNRGINFFRIFDEWSGSHFNAKFNNDLYSYDIIKYIHELLLFKNDMTSIIDNNKFLGTSFSIYVNDMISWANDNLKLIMQAFPIMTDSQSFSGFIIKSYWSSIIRELQQSGDALNMTDLFFPNGDPLYIFKENSEFFDALIEGMVLPYLHSRMPSDDELLTITNNVIEAFKFNIIDLFPDDKLIELVNSDLSSKFEEYVLSEVTRVYKDALYTDMNMKDKHLISLIETILDANEMIDSTGIPNGESLIEYSSEYETDESDYHLVNDTMYEANGLPLI